MTNVVNMNDRKFVRFFARIAAKIREAMFMRVASRLFVVIVAA
jgi:hypothetical protein